MSGAARSLMTRSPSSPRPSPEARGNHKNRDVAVFRILVPIFERVGHAVSLDRGLRHDVEEDDVRFVLEHLPQALVSGAGFEYLQEHLGGHTLSLIHISEPTR